MEAIREIFDQYPDVVIEDSVGERIDIDSFEKHVFSQN